jgi:hypothetical protein
MAAPAAAAVAAITALVSTSRRLADAVSEILAILVLPPPVVPPKTGVRALVEL